MKFDFNVARDYIDKIEKDFKNLNNALNNIKEGLEMITDTNYWKSMTHDSYVKELDALFQNIENVSYVSSNTNAYLAGVLNNYSSINQYSSSLFDLFGVSIAKPKK